MIPARNTSPRNAPILRLNAVHAEAKLVGVNPVSSGKAKKTHISWVKIGVVLKNSVYPASIADQGSLPLILITATTSPITMPMTIDMDATNIVSFRPPNMYGVHAIAFSNCQL